MLNGNAALMNQDKSEPFTLDHYRAILESALNAGYTFTAFDKAGDLGPEALACLLRHDCDNDLKAAAQIAKIESKKGVRSTYFIMTRSTMYNTFSPYCGSYVRDILSHGHWLGLHFDERPFEGLSSDELARQVDRERNWLSTEFNTQVDVVSFHQPSKRILSNSVKVSCVNTYCCDDLPGFHYLSDSNMIWRQGCPSHFFREKRHSRLQLLLHPEWWTEEQLDLEKKWEKMLQHQFHIMQRNLLEREDAYLHARRLLFERSSSGPS